MEDYKEKYEMALEGIQEILSSGQDSIKMPQLQLRLQGIFPELKESEDEKFRKYILKCCEETIQANDRGLELSMDTTKKLKNWLEKQAGQKPFDYESANIHQKDFAPKDYHDIDPHFGMSVEDLMPKEKPADKVEPKFHEGEWIVWKNKCYKVNCNGCGYELIDQNGLSTSLEYGTVDTSARLYDVIKDAKDGDVLYSPSHRLIWIYKDSKHYYACINLNCITNHVAINDSIIIPSDVCPADRVQKSILFQKMEEAGYEWNVEKKEPKNIEDEIEIPFGAKDSELQEETYYIPKGFHAEIEDDKVVIKKGEKSAAWSDEDDYNLQCMIAKVTLDIQKGNIGRNNELIDWLKSIKQRIEWKPSEEQMEAFEHFVRSFGESGTISPYSDNTKLLYSLLQDLKKL